MKKNKFLVLGALFLAIVIFNYFALLPLNLRYTGTFVLVLLILLPIYLIFSKNNFEKTFTNYSGKMIETYKPKKLFWYIILGSIGLMFLHSLSSTPLIFSKSYQTLIGDVEEEQFIENFTAIKTNQLPEIDHNLALLLGDKKLGSERGLGSEFHVGEFTDILVAGKLVAVAPLEYNGFFKWLNNDGTPGYIKVDKVTGDVELVREINDKEIKLKYMPSAYFNKDLKRHTYLNGNMDNQLYKYSFELDDEGYPYWIITKTQKTIGINGGDDVKSVVIVDPQTGETTEYLVKDVPGWVDMVYPKELVLKQLDDWGIYVNGFWNTIFGEKNIVHITSGSRRVFNENTVYHYTGLTSSGADESTVGFAFINTKTKKTNFYAVTGATEEAAMSSAEGKVQNLGYYATFPLPINIDDYPTFFITLKDSKGLIKQYAFVNITDYSIVGNGETIEKAKTSYLNALGQDDVLTNEDEQEEISGEINRIGFDISDGETTFYIVLKENENLYYGASNISKELSVTKAGDMVILEVNGMRIIEFDNENIE